MTHISPFAQKVAQKAFFLGDRLNVHVLRCTTTRPWRAGSGCGAPNLEWRRRLDPVRFHWDIDEQAAWVRDNAGEYRAELPLAEL